MLKFKFKPVKGNLYYCMCSPGGFRYRFEITSQKDIEKAVDFAIDHECDLWFKEYARLKGKNDEFGCVKSQLIYDPYGGLK